MFSCLPSICLYVTVFFTTVVSCAETCPIEKRMNAERSKLFMTVDSVEVWM
jgi:hypothetical protein